MSIVNKPAAVKTGTGKGLTIERIYTTAGVHPYDTVKWERRDVVQTNWKSGEVIFEQKGAITSDSDFMESSCRLQSGLRRTL